jgi:hypothetical protein
MLGEPDRIATEDATSCGPVIAHSFPGGAHPGRATSVNHRALDTATFTAADAIYNVRFDPIEDVPKLASRQGPPADDHSLSGALFRTRPDVPGFPDYTFTG